MIIIRNKNFSWFNLTKDPKLIRKRKEEGFSDNFNDISSDIINNMGHDSKKIFEVLYSASKFTKNLLWKYNSGDKWKTNGLEIELVPDEDFEADQLSGLLFEYSLDYDSWYLSGYKWVHKFKRITSFNNFMNIFKSHIKKYAPYEKEILNNLK